MQQSRGEIKMKDKAVGFYFTLIAAVLAVIGLILYPNVMYKLPVVYVFCIAAIVLTLIVLAGSFAGKQIPASDYLPVINAALMACAAVWAVYLMVNQIGYVIAELDEKSTIMGLVYFEVAAILAMLVNIAGAFLRQDK